MKRRRSIGFTLVELLVVIAIIGILIGLLLPAINAAREAGRRTTCMNNLKQIALALNTYDSVNGCLPSGLKLKSDLFFQEVNEDWDPWAQASVSQDGYSGASWMLFILPFMEHHEIYDQWDLAQSVYVNRELAQTDIKEFYCPSRRSGMRKGDDEIAFMNWTIGGTDYGGCTGRLNYWVNTVEPPTGAHKICAPKWIVPGLVPDADGDPSIPYKIGVFSVNSKTTRNQITDGTSNTIMIGELQRLHNPGDVPLGQSPVYYGPSRTSNDGWAAGGVSSLFDCAVYDEGGDLAEPRGINSEFFEDPGSEHPGGAHFAAVDGSVHFISEDVNSQTLACLASMADSFLVQFPDQ